MKWTVLSDNRTLNNRQQYGPESLPGALMLCGLMLSFILRPNHYLHLFCCF